MFKMKYLFLLLCICLSSFVSGNQEEVEETVKEILTGINKMKETVPNFEENLKSIGKHEVEYIDDPLDRIQEEIDLTKRSHLKSWNVISDVLQDVQDPSRSPKAPKTLSDLRTAVDALEQNYKTNEEHLTEAIEEALAEAADLLKPVVLLMDMLIKTAGENHPMMDKLSGGNIENVLGRTILRLTKVKKGEEKVGEIKLFEHLQKMSKVVSALFKSGARKDLTTVWKGVNVLLSAATPREMWSGEDLAVQLMAARMDLENTGQDYLAKIVKGMKKPEA